MAALFCGGVGGGGGLALRCTTSARSHARTHARRCSSMMVSAASVPTLTHVSAAGWISCCGELHDPVPAFILEETAPRVLG